MSRLKFGKIAFFAVFFVVVPREID